MKTLFIIMLFIFISCENSDKNSPNDNDKDGTEIQTTLAGIKLIKYGSDYQEVTHSPSTNLLLTDNQSSLYYIKYNNGSATGETKMARLSTSFNTVFFQSEPSELTSELRANSSDAIWWNVDVFTYGAEEGVNYFFLDTNESGTFETLVKVFLNSADYKKSYFVGKVINTDDSHIVFADGITAFSQL